MPTNGTGEAAHERTARRGGHGRAACGPRMDALPSPSPLAGRWSVEHDAPEVATHGRARATATIGGVTVGGEIVHQPRPAVAASKAEHRRGDRRGAAEGAEAVPGSVARRVENDVEAGEQHGGVGIREGVAMCGAARGVACRAPCRAATRRRRATS